MVFEMIFDFLVCYVDVFLKMFLCSLFQEDLDCFVKYFVCFDDLLFDYFKIKLDLKVFELLFDLVYQVDVESRCVVMFEGGKINIIEGWVVLYMVLCNWFDEFVLVDGMDVMFEICVVLDIMVVFFEVVCVGDLIFFIDVLFIDVVNIGIGGFDFGFVMIILVLVLYYDGLELYYVLNVDGVYIVDMFEKFDFVIIFVIVVFKIFIIIEMMINVQMVCKWIVGVFGEEVVFYYFVVVLIVLDKVVDFGIEENRVFGFWDWVGGCYFIWLVIGFFLMIVVGFDVFIDFLEGVYVFDMYF